MHSKSLYLLALTAGASLASAFPQHFPVLRRVVDELNEEATREAHQRDDTATRAFSSVPITTGDGKCLFVDPLSGDFRANLLPVQIKDCDGSDGQKWDIITAGKHNDREGAMLVVSALTQGCLNYDPRRQPGDQVNIFSCGGRAAGEGTVTNSQLFSFATVTSGPLSLQPLNEAGTCFTSVGVRLDKVSCDTSDELQSFTFGATEDGAGPEDPEPTTTIPDNNTIPTFAPFPTDGFRTIPAPTTDGATPAPTTTTTTPASTTTSSIPNGAGGNAPEPTVEPTPTDDGEVTPEPTETEAPTETQPPTETETPSPTTGDDEVVEPTPTDGAGNGGNGGTVGGGNNGGNRNGNGRGRGNGRNRGNGRGNRGANRGTGTRTGAGRQNGRNRGNANGRNGRQSAQDCKNKNVAPARV
ncbi:hypothetical protein TWF718_008353 [Orbilia javanica]|uniref:Ricin B lectin domain-containing protein n=1 Tax=Orbilia javanica TaxID=47235 RepID=A0AAN8N0X3_9PEZI